MKKFFLCAAGGLMAALLLGSLFHSCVRDGTGERETAAPLNERLSIYDARIFFDEYRDGMALGPLTGTRSEFSVPTPSWQDAGFSEFLGYEVIEVPFEGISFSIVPAAGGITDMKSNTAVKLLAGLNSCGEIYYRVLFIRADEVFMEQARLTAGMLSLDRIRENFSGDLLLYQTDGNYLKGFRLVDGEIYSGIWKKSVGTHSTATRSVEDQCTYLVIDWAWCWDDAPESCVYDYTEILGVICPDRPPGEADPGEGGGPPPSSDPPVIPDPCYLCGSDPCRCAEIEELVDFRDPDSEQAFKKDILLIMGDCFGGAMTSYFGRTERAITIVYDPTLRESATSGSNGTIKWRERVNGPLMIFEELFHQYQYGHDPDGALRGNREIEAKVAVYKYATRNGYSYWLQTSFWKSVGAFVNDPCEDTYDELTGKMRLEGYGYNDFTSYEILNLSNYNDLKRNCNE